MKIYQEIFSESVSEILYNYDPALLGKFSVQEDQYIAEAVAIILYLNHVSDLRSMKWLVYEVFVKYFSKESIAPADDECYQNIAEEIWNIWQEKIVLLDKQVI